MTDIVDRLRDDEHGASWQLQLEAADEIERLRKENTALKQDLEAWGLLPDGDDND